VNRNRTAATALADALALALGQRFPNWRTRFLNLSRHRVAPHATTTRSHRRGQDRLHHPFRSADDLRFRPGLDRSGPAGWALTASRGASGGGQLASLSAAGVKTLRSEDEDGVDISIPPP